MRSLTSYVRPVSGVWPVKGLLHSFSGIIRFCPKEKRKKLVTVSLLTSEIEIFILLSFFKKIFILMGVLITLQYCFKALQNHIEVLYFSLPHQQLIHN